MIPCANATRSQCHMQCGRAAVGENGVAIAIPSRKLFLEGPAVRAKGMLPAFKGCHHKLAILIAHRRPRFNHPVRYDFRAAMYSQIIAPHRSRLHHLLWISR